MQKSKLQLKIQNLLLRFWPVLFIIAIWLVFSSPYFIKGKVPYASTYQVNFFAPWSHYEQFWGPVKNNAMPDVHTQIYPWKKFTVETWKNGQIPLWNPYSFSGNPHLANFQSAVLSPGNALFSFLPFIDAWSILILLQPLLAGIFMLMFLKTLKISATGSLISSVSFMFCGFIVVWMAYGTLAYAILYLPLALFAIEKYSDTQQKKFPILLTLTVPLSFFSGHFQISFYFLTVTLLYALFKIITARKQALLIFLPSTIFLGLILSLPQLLPSIKLYSQSVRSELFQVGEAIPFQYLVTVFSPDFFGNPVTRNDWFGHYAEWASFIGIVPLILAIYAVVRQKSKTVIFFTALGLVSLLLAVKSPVSIFFVSLKIPVLSTSALSRIIVLFSFSFAVLAGLGFDRLAKDMVTVGSIRKSKKLIALLILIIIFFTSLWLLLFFGKVYPDNWLIVAKRNLALPTMLFLGAAAIILITIKQKKLLLVASCYLLIATSFDSWRFAQKWMPFDPKELVYPSVPVVWAMKDKVGDGRVFGNIGAEVSSYYGFPIIEGYDPLYINRYGEFIRSAGTGEFLQGERSVVKLDRRGKFTDRVLDLLGVSLIFHPIIDTNAGWAYPVWEDQNRYAVVYQDDKFQLFQNAQALPRASLFYDFEIEKNDQEIIKKFYSDRFNFRKRLILEEEIDFIKKEGKGSAQITNYTPNHVTIRASTSESALLFLADNFYPGWKATVDGKETKIYRADYTFRAIIIPAGESQIEFTYENWYL